MSTREKEPESKPSGDGCELRASAGSAAIARIQETAAKTLRSLTAKPPTMEEEIFRFVTDKWGPKSGLDVALKLAEETGEVAGAVTRLNEDRGTEDQIADELGDVLIVASQLAAILGSTLEQIRSDRWEAVIARSQNGRRERRAGE